MKFKNTKDKKEDIKSRKVTYRRLIAIRLLCNADFSTATVRFTRPQDNIFNGLGKNNCQENKKISHRPGENICKTHI